MSLPTIAKISGTAIVLAALTFVAGPAYAGMDRNDAQCTANVVITGSDGSKTAATQDTDKLTVDPKSSYSGTGSVYGGTGTETRANGGSVKIDLPPPLPDYGPDDWSWSNKATDSYASTDPKTGSFDLPGWVPRGFYVPLVGSHSEKGKTVCTYAGEIKIKGSVTSSPVFWGSAALALVFLILTSMAGMARPTKGA